MNRTRKWLREEVIDALKYLYEIYNVAPLSPSHYRYLAALEHLFNPRRPLPSVAIIHNFWPNVRDAWRACQLSPTGSLITLKLDFNFTPATDDQLKTIYKTHTVRLRRLQQLEPLAVDTKIPVPALALRAVQLELDTRSHLNWTKPELALLESHRHLSKQRISQTLAAHGFDRSPQAMKIIMGRKAFLKSAAPSHYSLIKLSKLVGLDQHALTSWCLNGWLPFEKKGTARKQQQGGDSYLVKRTDVAAFFRTYPEMIHLGKINQIWFLELLRETDPILLAQQDNGTPLV